MRIDRRKFALISNSFGVRSQKLALGFGVENVY